MAVHVVAAASFRDAAAQLEKLDAAPDDLVLIHPDRDAVVVGDDQAIAHAHAPFGDAIAVAADRVLQSPVTPALCGRVTAVRAVLAAVATDAGDDCDRISAVAAHHELALDTGAQVFAVLDGTGTDVVAVAGGLHGGGERPVVAIDAGGGARMAPLVDALNDPGSRDLGALFGYDAIPDQDEPVRVVAPDILVLPFWTPEFCAVVIRAAEAAGVWTSDPDDPVPGAEVSLFSISPRLVALIDEDMHTRIWPQLRAHWPEAALTPISDAFVIRYEAGGDVEGLPLHHDVAQISASVRLNDGYTGGSLSFPRQGWNNADVPVGYVSVWPSLVTHPHRAEPVERGVKYGLTIWLALPD